jgi:hypothetical protein
MPAARYRPAPFFEFHSLRKTNPDQKAFSLAFFWKHQAEGFWCLGGLSVRFTAREYSAPSPHFTPLFYHFSQS